MLMIIWKAVTKMREFNTRTTEGNYSITFETDDRKAFEQVQTLCRILIDHKNGDLIPIGWIENYMRKKFCFADWYGGFINGINMMLDEWMEEE